MINKKVRIGKGVNLFSVEKSSRGDLAAFIDSGFV